MLKSGFLLKKLKGNKRNICRNPSFRFATKARACKVVGQKGSPRVKPHALVNARKCEGIDHHTLKGTPTLGLGVPVDS